VIDGDTHILFISHSHTAKFNPFSLKKKQQWCLPSENVHVSVNKFARSPRGVLSGHPRHPRTPVPTPSQRGPRYYTCSSAARDAVLTSFCSFFIRHNSCNPCSLCVFGRVPHHVKISFHFSVYLFPIKEQKYEVHIYKSLRERNVSQIKLLRITTNEKCVF